MYLYVYNNEGAIAVKVRMGMIVRHIVSFYIFCQTTLKIFLQVLGIMSEYEEKGNQFMECITLSEFS